MVSYTHNHNLHVYGNRRIGDSEDNCYLLTSKAQDSLYVSPALTFRSSVFYSQCIYVFHMDLRTNSDYSFTKH